VRKTGNKTRSAPLANAISLVLAVGVSTALFLAALTVLPDDASARRKHSRSKVVSAVKKPKRPLVLMVSLRRQRIVVFDGEKVIRSAPISSGRAGRRTPKGIFSVIQKQRMHYSNLYNSAPMPFMQRITWSGVALHLGHLPGHAASHGCIRLPGGFARSLYKMTSMGTRVIVTRNVLKPRLFSHEALFKPLPFDETPRRQAETGKTPAAGTPAAAQKAGAGAGTVRTVAETQSSGSGVSISSIVGVSPANASEVASQNSPPAQMAAAGQPGNTVSPSTVSPRLTRSQITAARKAKMAALKAALAKSQKALKAARKLIVQKRIALREAGKTAAIAKRHVLRLKRHAANARQLVKRAARALIAFERRYAGKTFDPVADAGVLSKAMAREDVLDEHYFTVSEEADVADIDARDMRSERREALRLVQQAKDNLLHASKDAKQKLAAYNAARLKLRTAVRAEKRWRKPISIFVSRRTGKLYIRQGYKPIYETPVKITDPDLPIGTHVFTALQFNADKTSLIWSVVTINDHGRTHRRRHSRRSRRSRSKAVAPISYPKPRPDSALERIKVPEDARYKIAQLIKPGSSLIISDRRTSNETGEYTDFIVSLN